MLEIFSKVLDTFGRLFMQHHFFFSCPQARCFWISIIEHFRGIRKSRITWPTAGIAMGSEKYPSLWRRSNTSNMYLSPLKYDFTLYLFWMESFQNESFCVYLFLLVLKKFEHQSTRYFCNIFLIFQIFSKSEINLCDSLCINSKLLKGWMLIICLYKLSKGVLFQQ